MVGTLKFRDEYDLFLHRLTLSIIPGFSFGSCRSHGDEMLCFRGMQMFITDHNSLQLFCAEAFQFNLHHHTLISDSPFCIAP